MKETFRRVCRYAGQSVRPRHIATEIGEQLGTSVSNSKVQDAIAFLVDAMLVHEIPHLELLTKKSAHPPKLCLCDHFVRRAWLQETVPIDPDELEQAEQSVRTSAGHLIESVLGYHLKGIAGLDVAWFAKRKKEPEVDFILTIGMRRIPIEVKYQRVCPDLRDLKGIRSFCSKKQYNAPFGLVITQDTGGWLDKEKRILALPAPAFLLVGQSFSGAH